MSSPIRLFLFLTVLLTSTGLALADVVHLKDGRTLEGSVTREGDTLVVRHRFGEARVEMSDVLRIEDRPDAWDELDLMPPEDRARSEVVFMRLVIVHGALGQGCGDRPGRCAGISRLP